MAAPSAGWLIEDSGSTPYKRSLQLLGTFLDEEQRQQVERWGGFAHPDGPRLYWIPVKGSPRCALLDTNTVVSYCVAPRERRGSDKMPGPDVALTHLMWLRHDPEGFRKEANVMSSWPLPEDLTTEGILEHLARGRGSNREGPRLRGPAYRPFRPGRKVTARERTVGLAMARDLRVGLQVEHLRELFERNKVEVTDEMLKKLAGAARDYQRKVNPKG